MKKSFLLIYAIAFFTLSSCSGDTRQSQGIEKQNSIKNTQEENSAGIEINSPLVIPPGFDQDESTQNSAGDQAEGTANDLPALLAMKGVNVETLFDNKISDTDKRFDRLENTMAEFLKEYQQIRPAIIRLSAIEKDMQNLLDELESFTSAQIITAETIEDTPPKVPPQTFDKASAPEPMNAAALSDDQPTSNKKPAETTDLAVAIALKSIRIGQHADKIRIVLDTSKSFKPDVSLDNEEGVLFVDLNNCDIAADLALEKKFSKTPLLSSYSINNSQASKYLTFALKGKTEIKLQEVLPPKANTNNYRFVIDLKL